jgi:predicted SAM-dependent methyltransferase
VNDKLPYLNLGCGGHFNKQWVNVDFEKKGDDVIGHNLLQGIPFEADMFEVVYHSHVLEHFQKSDGIKFIAECYRVLKPGGTIRVVVPDLEQIANNYLRLLNDGKQEPGNESIRNDYDWILIEMFDQTVRNQSGGEMIKYLSKQQLENEEFIYHRIGHEGKMLRQAIVNNRNPVPQKVSFPRKAYRRLRSLTHPGYIRNGLLKLMAPSEYKLLQLARFRTAGEVHQWMYDIYSISNLLKDAGFKNIEKRTFAESNIKGWAAFGLDEVDNQARKPDSLFVEALK